MPTSNKTSYSEQELLQHLAAGDDQAFSIIYDRYNAIIFSAAMVFVKNSDSAREIVQQVFVRLWEKRAGMVHIDNFQDYVMVISRNLIYDQFRKKNMEARKLSELAERSEGASRTNGVELAEVQDYARILQSAIRQLPPQQKRIYQMIQEEGLSYEDVASSLGLSKLTVKKHLELARGFVRKYVSKSMHFFMFLLTIGVSISYVI